MKPLVSIVVPVYNIEKYVSKCLESLIQQSYQDLEIIVVDDGSTDQSGKICDGFALNDTRVKVFHKKNGGLSLARNFGISKARGELVALIDGDDYVRKNFIKEMAGALKDDVDVVICGYDEIKPNEGILSGKEATIKLLVEQENMEIVAWNKLYRKELFKDIKYPVGKKYEDSLTTYKILAKARKIVYVDKSLYHYVKRPGSIMDEAKILERLKARYEAAEEAVKYLKDDEKMKQAAKVAVLTARYAFMDAAVKRKIDKNYFILNSEWIKKHKVEFKNNKVMTRKLKLYNFLNSVGFYKIFRTIV